MEIHSQKESLCSNSYIHPLSISLENHNNGLNTLPANINQSEYGNEGHDDCEVVLGVECYRVHQTQELHHPRHANYQTARGGTLTQGSIDVNWRIHLERRIWH